LNVADATLRHPPGMPARLALPDDATASPELAAEYAAARGREGRVMITANDDLD
jgi:hypothetical protein